MGSPKALLPWGKTTVLEQIIGQIRDAGLPNIVMVSGAHHPNLLPVARRQGIRVCHHPDWERGIGSSLSRGIGYVMENFPDAGAVLVLLSDQPFVTGRYFREMLRAQATSPGLIIASQYGDAAGVPVLLPRNVWKKIEELPPEQGARAFIAKYRAQSLILETGFPLVDIDTPESYQRALAMAGHTPTKNEIK